MKIIGIDAHLSSAIENTFKIKAFALRDIGLREAEDLEIFKVAKA